MKKGKYLKLLDNIQEDREESPSNERFLIIDGLNLFFRNFAILNMVNPEGAHIGGLGGFFRSLGALIRNIQPTSVYVVFDGEGSTINRKNLLPEYKAGRDIRRITNWDIFEDLKDEDAAKVNQIVRIIHYLQALPIKIISLERAEADDVISHLATTLPKTENDKAVIVSVDKDFLQLVSDRVIVYRPIEKKYYTPQIMRETYNFPTENFIIYKTLMGDASDNLSGVKGLGIGKLKKLFPEIFQRPITLQEIYDISVERLEEHVIYARLIQNFPTLKKKFLIMDLSNPMLDENDRKEINEVVESKELPYFPDEFVKMYNQDQLGRMVGNNVGFWVKETFEKLTV